MIDDGPWSLHSLIWLVSAIGVAALTSPLW
jgi:hypothetical protein